MHTLLTSVCALARWGEEGGFAGRTKKKSADRRRRWSSIRRRVVCPLTRGEMERRRLQNERERGGKKTRGSITMAYGGGLHGRTVPAWHIYTSIHTVQNVSGSCPKGQRLITEMAPPQKLHVTLAPLLFPPTVSLLTRPQTSPLPLLNIRCTRLSPYPGSFSAEGGRTWSTGKGGRGGGRPTAAASLSLSSLNLSPSSSALPNSLWRALFPPFPMPMY